MALKSLTGIHQDLFSLKAVIEELQTKVTALAALANEIKADYNAHTHTENTAASYAQNASTQGPSATVSSADVTI
jgi:hypothetical protein